MPHLSITTFNLENLFYPPYETPPNFSYVKPQEKIEKLAKVINELDSDIIFLQEVGGIDSLKNFVHKDLENKYHYSMIKGNSERDIEIAYIMKKELPFRYEHFTHRNRELNFLYPHEEQENKECEKRKQKNIHSSHLLSRDISELRVFSSSQKLPHCILLGVHLKSQLDKEGIDSGGKKRREAEFKLLLSTYQHLFKRYQGKVPIILLGDFNGSANLQSLDPEFKDIYKKTDLLDILELLNLPEKQKSTYFLFGRQGDRTDLQLDYIFINKSLRPHICSEKSGIYYYKMENGISYPLPQSIYERYPLPSDHYPLKLHLNNFY